MCMCVCVFPCRKKTLTAMSSEIKCINDHDDFCFVCGRRVFTTLKAKRDQIKKRYINAPKFCETYKNLFNRDPLERNVQWSPEVSCTMCFSQIIHPARKRTILSPVEWTEPKNHPHDCYFCQSVFPSVLSKEKESEIQYANVSSVKKAKYTVDLDASETRTDSDDEAIGHELFQMNDFEEGEFSGASGSREQTGNPNLENVPDDPMNKIHAFFS